MQESSGDGQRAAVKDEQRTIMLAAVAAQTIAGAVCCAECAQYGWRAAGGGGGDKRGRKTLAWFKFKANCSASSVQ